MAVGEGAHSMKPLTEDNVVILSDEQAKRAAREAFEKFWFWCPVKKGKADARDLFVDIIKPGGCDRRKADKDAGAVVGMVETHLEATPEELISAAKKWFLSLPNKPGSSDKDTAYCKHPQTWLRHKGWEDYQ